MTELYFLRHGKRIDHDPTGTALVEDYQPYNPSLSDSAIPQFEAIAEELIASSTNITEPTRKTIHIHFSPYLRCVQSADLLITSLKNKVSSHFQDPPKIKYSLLGDFALSEWIHTNMNNKPPFYDSNDAYELYTPNLKLIKNKTCLSNFRPTITLGNWNGYDLSYSDYQERSRDYFKKLIATYDKPIHKHDIIVVISHGYMINNFLSFFINTSNFNEVPEAKLNYAQKGHDDQWRLVKDCLGLTETVEDTTLNLDTDIVYYKTNFIKKDELEELIELTPLESTFSLITPSSLELPKNSFSQPNLSPNANKFKIKEEFKLKVMNDEAFKKTFDLTNKPVKPVTPELSPNSLPTRTNSIIDLSKLTFNKEIYKPRKLRYSNSGDYPIDTLNSKLNSQLNLLTMNTSSPTNSQNSFDSFSSLSKNLQSLRSNSQVNMINTAPSPTGFHSNYHILSPTSFHPLDPIKEPEPDANDAKKIKLINSIVPEKKKVFTFQNSDSEDDDEPDDKRYMWFGGNK